MESHLLQMRGLKQTDFESKNNEKDVASFTDAWIETFLFASMSIILPSRIFYRCVD